MGNYTQNHSLNKPLLRAAEENNVYFVQNWGRQWHKRYVVLSRWCITLNLRRHVTKKVGTFVNKAHVTKKGRSYLCTSLPTCAIQKRLKNLEHLCRKSVYSDGYDDINIRFSELLLLFQIRVN